MFLHLIGALFAMSLRPAPSAAQPWSYTSTPTEYQNTVQYEVDDDAAFNPSTDPRVNLTMNCLAANGYGQWTMTTNVGSNANISGHDWNASPAGSFTNGQSGWFLLGNTLAKPAWNASSGAPDCQPPGVVSGGSFSGTLGSPKATANLNGAVRYVWPASDNLSFIVQGLSDIRTAGGGHSPEVDITVATLPVPVSTRQIVKNGIYSYPNATVQDHAVPTPLNHTIDNTEADSRDEFDIACDVYHLYIVWSSKTNTAIGVTEEIWATVIDMVDGTQVSGFPIKVSTTGSSGMRPTVACDVRNSGGTAKFDVAYIDKSSNAVVLQEFSGTTVVTGHSEILPLQFKNPKAASPVNISMTGISHARVLVSSVLGVSTPMHAVYAIDVNPLATPVTHDDIVLYKGITWSTATDKARYVDGVQMNNGTGTGSYPAPIITDGTKTQLQNIDDEPITAFANPYDQQDAGSTSANYNQFHCVYRVNYTTKKDGVNNTPINPLFLVRGYDNGTSFPTSSTDTRLLLNRDNTCSSSDPGHSTIEDPTSYCAAVNQMGIHIHWRVSTTSPQKHYYARNIRTFDEEIEENTLATNDCYIADGSGHGGLSTGALIARDGIEMTLWTDPNYGAVNSSTTAGLYLHDPSSSSATGYYGLLNEGSIIYNTNGLELDVTPSSIYGHTHFYTFPVSRFDVASGVTDGGKVNVGPGGLWDFFGAASPSKLVPGVTTLTGSSSGPTYAGLQVHGGARFPGIQLTGTYGDFEILYEQNISPMNTSSTPNLDESGLIQTIEDGTTLSECTINSYLPTNLDQTVFLIVGTGSGATSGHSSFSATDCAFTNHPSGTGYFGSAFMQFNAPINPNNGIGWPSHPDITTVSGTNGPDDCTITGGSFTRFGFRAYDPHLANITLTGALIEGVGTSVIQIVRTANLGDDYGNITISGNTLLSPVVGDKQGSPSGIKFENFNKSGLYGHINVNGNTFDNTGNEVVPVSTGTAIEFWNTTGNIEGNTIVADGLTTGIANLSYQGAEPFDPWEILSVPTTTYTYMCNNYVYNIGRGAGWPGQGLLTNYYQGYVKLCRFDQCWLGYLSMYKDNSKVVFSSVLNCRGNGIVTVYQPDEIDLSGIHGAISTGDDIAAYDTIAYNSSYLSGYAAAQVLLGAGTMIDYGTNHDPGWWTAYGENNTIADYSAPTTVIFGLNGSTGTCSLGNIDNNFWGARVSGTVHSLDPSIDAVHWDPTDGTKTNCQAAISYGSLASVATSELGKSFDVNCGGDFSAAHSGSGSAVRAKKMANPDPCQVLHAWLGIAPASAAEYKIQFDSLKKFIETCTSATDGGTAFAIMTGDLQQFDVTDSDRFNRYRIWLASVAYLNHEDPYYFCNCVHEMVYTFNYGWQGDPFKAQLAILEFLATDSLCNDVIVRQEITRAKKDLHSIWLAGDTTKPQDTTLPTLDSLGVGSLLHRSVAISIDEKNSNYFGSASSNPNPFVKETELTYVLNRMTYVTVAIYDELGRMVWGDGKGHSLDAGTHTILIDGTGLPSGTLYARISTGFGEVKTVKLVHQ